MYYDFMQICLCNSFNDEKVKEHLAGQKGPVKLCEVYRACSGGKKPDCGGCAEPLKAIIQAHNKKFQSETK